MELKGLKVKIGIRIANGKEGGNADHPNFNVLPVVIASGIDWAYYVDTYGKGWKYDKTSGHKETTADSPIGQQWGLLLVPADFATEAVAAFPGICTFMSEAEVGTFWEEKVTIKQSDPVIKQSVLDEIAVRDSLAIERTSADAKALDPNDPTPGVVANKEKLWADYKVKHGVTIV